jgi:hypothetical protein
MIRMVKYELHHRIWKTRWRLLDSVLRVYEGQGVKVKGGAYEASLINFHDEFNTNSSNYVIFEHISGSDNYVIH